MKRAFILLSFALLSGVAHAHKASDAYLSLDTRGETVRGQWDIALRDLDYALGLDSNDDGRITWGELRAHRDAVNAYALTRLTVRADQQHCALHINDYLTDDHSDGAYVVLRFTSGCAARAATLDVAYGALFDVDPQHRGLARLTTHNGTRNLIFSPEQPRQIITLRDTAPVTQTLRDYGHEGMWHIWRGYDHLLFLFSLLLPAVLLHRGRAWQPASSPRVAARDVFKVVSAFTLAHSVTLSLVALGWVSFSSRWIESLIAASVVIAALNNIFPVIHGRRWAMAGLFGLIHGCGFAGALNDLGLPQGAKLWALLGFNLGVEAGQLAIVLVFLPLAYTLRRTWFYQRVAVTAGSTIIIAVASVWLVERAFDLRLWVTG